MTDDLHTRIERLCAKAEKDWRENRVDVLAVHVDELRAALTESLRDLLIDEQHRRCAYGTRHGDGRTCDCKYASPLRPPTSETTGCPELRDAINALDRRPR